MRFEKQMWNGDSIFLQEVTLLVKVWRRVNMHFPYCSWREFRPGRGSTAIRYTNVDIVTPYLFKINEHYQDGNKTF